MLAPEEHQIRDAVVPVGGSVVRVGDLEVDVVGTEGTLEVEVSPRVRG